MIGIYGIFIGSYIELLPNFIKQVESNFCPTQLKKFFIVSDCSLEESPIVQNKLNVEWLIVQKIGWPYETLYRFHYFLQFTTIKECSHIFFLNSNIQLQSIVDSEMLPIPPYQLTFVLHRCHSKNTDSTKCNSMESNSQSTCYIPPCHNLRYIIGGLFGGTTFQFMKLCCSLAHDVFVNEDHNHIAIWHDETHLNYYVNRVLNNNVHFLGVEYHGYGNCPQNKVDFKKKPKRWIYQRRHTYGKVISNSYFKQWKKNQIKNDLTQLVHREQNDKG